jgi:flagellum-specific ATP synthase
VEQRIDDGLAALLATSRAEDAGIALHGRLGLHQLVEKAGAEGVNALAVSNGLATEGNMTVALGQIARWAQADVVVMALIGERSREISDFIDTELGGTARDRTVTIAVPAADAMLCRVRGAQRAFAIAEYFRSQGRHVLLILDSLSRVVHGAREVAMARGEPSGARGFPPSALQLIADLAERAGGDRRSGGAITLVATVLAESDDRADPVVDAARGVMDGHVLLSRRLAGRGQFPPIDLIASASRVMPSG